MCVIGEPRVEHRETQQPPDADPRRPGPDEHDPGIGEAPTGGAQTGQHARDDDRGRALDVVVERGQPVLVSIQQAERVLLLEVLELDEAPGQTSSTRRDERFHDRVVRRAPQPRPAIAEVERIGEERRVVRSDIERDGEGQRGMDPAARRVQRELADRDGHAARALVAEAQDALVVGHDDEPHVLVRTLAEDLGHAVAGRRA